MAIPYTRDVLAQLRVAARDGTPYDSVIAQLGWSPSMLERVCRSHGIDIAPRVIGSKRTILDAPLSAAEQLALLIESLPPGQTRAITVLRAAALVSDEFIPPSAISGCEPSDSRTRAVHHVIGLLDVKLSLARVPYRIERKVGEGYRLLFTGAKT